jgi:transcriptional regulator with XRE-family HTH domain
MERNLMREIRQAHNYTQQEMADKLGCAVLTVKRSEKENKLPRSGAVLRNLKALGTLAGIEVEVAA